ncbi:MAG TPA: oligosaccharide flippase family protein [Gaiellaceae bacterium]|nr:oligosaccharide flippase family protein [Gaiellaceae bacterium]
MTETASGAAPESASGADGRPFLRLAKQSLAYGFAGAALQFAGIVTVPVFARRLDPVEYGVLELTLVSFALAVTVADAGIATAAQRSFYDYGPTERFERARVVTTALATTAVVAVAASALVVLLREPAAMLLYGRSEHAALVLAAIVLPFAALAQYLRAILRVHEKPLHYVVSSLIAAGAFAAVGSWLVLSTGIGVAAPLTALLVANAGACLYAAVVLRGAFVLAFAPQELRRMLAFGTPLVPAAVALWFVWFLDRIMLEKLSGLREVGEYAVANRIVAVLQIGVIGFSLAFWPFVLSLHSEDARKEGEVRARSVAFLVAGLAFAALVLTLFARELTAVVAPAYRDAHLAVGPLALGVVGHAVYAVVGAGIAIERRTPLFVAVTAAALGVNVVLNLVLIPPFGMVGAATATAAAFVALAAATYIVAQRIQPLEYPVLKLLAAVAAATALSAVAFAPTSGAVRAVANVAAITAFAVILRLLNIVDLGLFRHVRARLRTSRRQGRRADG